MTLPFVISIPHGAGRIPDDIAATLALTPAQVEASVDTGTLEIFGTLPALAVIQAEWNRLVVDLNRNAAATDPKGVIALIDYEGHAVFKPGCTPDDDQQKSRIQLYYHPFHARLEAALALPGVRGLFDCHSLNGVGPSEAPDSGQRRADIILGNNGDARGEARPGMGLPTCPPATFRYMGRIFREHGFSVALNTPYSGGFITTYYGEQLARESHFAVQIEINQDLTLEPQSQKTDRWKLKEVRSRVQQSLESIAELFPRMD